VSFPGQQLDSLQRFSGHAGQDGAGQEEGDRLSKQEDSNRNEQHCSDVGRLAKKRQPHYSGCDNELREKKHREQDLSATVYLIKAFPQIGF
jgi:hypothetical protein